MNWRDFKSLTKNYYRQATHEEVDWIKKNSDQLSFGVYLLYVFTAMFSGLILVACVYASKFMYYATLSEVLNKSLAMLLLGGAVLCAIMLGTLLYQIVTLTYDHIKVKMYNVWILDVDINESTGEIGQGYHNHYVKVNYKGTDCDKLFETFDQRLYAIPSRGYLIRLASAYDLCPICVEGEDAAHADSCVAGN